VKTYGGAWNGTPLHLIASDHLDAERQAKQAVHRRTGTPISDIDVKAVRTDTKTTFMPKNKQARTITGGDV